MPPTRTRNTIEDSRSETTSSTRDKSAMVAANANSKGRRGVNAAAVSGSALRDVTYAIQSAHAEDNTNDDGSKINWATLDISVLLAYRHSHHLDSPPAFTNSYNQRVLTRPGIGLLSPTMARHKSRQRVSKEHLAYAIRKDYNAAMINEPEIITNFIYTVYNQRKKFRMRFDPAVVK